ncbi:hypothetical protein GCM10011487_01820 [Steroidobacter agaridevorans]|uniref:Uncharacterized protein n=1 Tax=Steroidobacter agaridevorans TaxID=2695856 RepID=A0A829Y6E2_9GAMM|nr:hypothetical protein [Steroidobacter agaridevorans]GFE78182.1 hypothetical protein GCM10011487_01820 [Steroidobacter agaridevorans]
MSALPTLTSPPDPTMLAFESGSLDPARFNHRLHLSLAWSYLQRDGFPEGALHFRRHLQNYVAKAGAQSKYHETITWAYLVLLNEERCLRSPAGESFDAMIQRRPDLLDHRNGPIARCYSKSQLDSPEARRVFMLPAT